MPTRKKRSISMPPDLDAAVARAATSAQTTYSGWIAAVASKELTIQAGLAAVAEFEADEGAFTHDELTEADAWAREAVERSALTGRRTRQSA